MSIPHLTVKIVKNFDLAIEEIENILALSPFFSIDTEYDSSANNGCDLVQIGVLDYRASRESSRGAYEKVYQLNIAGPVSWYENCVVYIFVMAGVGKSLPLPMTRLLGNRLYRKIACGFESDAERFKYYGCKLESVLDIQHIATTLGFQKCSLEYLGERFVGVKKGKTPTKWGHISPQMIDYAAVDALLTLFVYLEMVNYKNFVQCRELSPRLEQLTDFYNWLTSSGHYNFTLPDITKIAANSYGSLKKEYSPREQIILIEKMLDKLVLLDHLVLKDGRYEIKSNEKGAVRPSEPATPPSCSDLALPVKEVSISEKDAVNAYLRTKVTGMSSGIKIESYLKCLANCNFLERPLHVRLNIARDVLAVLINNGTLEQRDEKIFSSE